MMNPGLQSGRVRRLRTMPIMMSSETYLPAARMGCACLPRSVPAAISARSMSPVAMWGMPNFSRSMFACVPLPLPGAPYSRRFTLGPSGPSGHLPMNGEDLRSLDEPTVLAHHQLRLQLFHRVQGHADDDEDGRAT